MALWVPMFLGFASWSQHRLFSFGTFKRSPWFSGSPENLGDLGSFTDGLIWGPGPNLWTEGFGLIQWSTWILHLQPLWMWSGQKGFWGVNGSLHTLALCADMVSSRFVKSRISKSLSATSRRDYWCCRGSIETFWVSPLQTLCEKGMWRNVTPEMWWNVP